VGRNIKQAGAVVFNGRDEVLAAGLLMGADGGIGTFYNVLPELFTPWANFFRPLRGLDRFRCPPTAHAVG
jgi:dihydrodipicolinate synthase/N-acetylneuraminate lyase